MAEFKLVLARKDGKCFQQVVKDKEAGVFLKKRLKDKISGKDIGMDGYEFEITGGSDKSGFPMRKGIQQKRQRITLTGKSVGFSGKDRNRKRQLVAICRDVVLVRKLSGQRSTSGCEELGIFKLAGISHGRAKEPGIQE